jgi:hypothetical protein
LIEEEEMHSKILTLIVVTINHRLRCAKTALETEEKSREIATLQGSICGWRKLSDLLMDNFGLNIPFMDDNEEPAPIIEGLETSEIKKLYEEMEKLIDSAAWKELTNKVAENKEVLKEHLITKADNARDLYLAQAQQTGLTIYQTIFQALRDEYDRRCNELDFDAEAIPEDAVPFDDPEAEQQLKLPNKQLALPEPEKKTRGKKKKDKDAE